MTLPVRILDLSGQRFGKLVAAEFKWRRRGRTVWLCDCDCGRKHLARASALRDGSVKSCGCTRRPTVRDLVGHRFGRLVVECRALNTPDGVVRWQCRCDCGEVRLVRATNLRSGKTTSCGCYRREVSTEQLLRIRSGDGVAA